MKKILMLLTNEFMPDPRVYKEARYLIAKGFQVTIFCWDRQTERRYKRKETVDGIRVIRCRIPAVAGTGRKQIPAFFKYICACRNYIQRHKFDYLHCNDIDGALAGYISGKNIRMVFDMHEFYEDYGYGSKWKAACWRYLTIFMIRHSIAALYTNGLYERKPYQFLNTKMYLLKNYPDGNLVRYLPKKTSDKLRIGYHGNLRSQILEFTALFEAVKGMEDVVVHIHGGGPDLEEILRISTRYENVFIHGPFNGARELTELYANTDIEYAGYRVGSATKEEQEVVKYFECIITGTPIILTESYTKMGREIIRNGYGLTCDTRDCNEIRKAILTFKDDRAFLNQCSEHELANAYKYDWNAAVKVLDKIY